MEQKKNLCAPIPLALHQRVREEQEQTGKSLADYITMVLTEYYEKKGGSDMSGKTRTLAFQVSEELFQKVKEYLAGHPGVSQKDFVIGLIEQAIAEWEAEQAPAAEAPQKETDTEGSDEADSQDEDNEVA